VSGIQNEDSRWCCWSWEDEGCIRRDWEGGYFRSVSLLSVKLLYALHEMYFHVGLQWGYRSVQRILLIFWLNRIMFLSRVSTWRDAHSAVNQIDIGFTFTPFSFLCVSVTRETIVSPPPSETATSFPTNQNQLHNNAPSGLVVEEIMPRSVDANFLTGTRSLMFQRYSPPFVVKRTAIDVYFKWSTRRRKVNKTEFQSRRFNHKATSTTLRLVIGHCTRIFFFWILVRKGPLVINFLYKNPTRHSSMWY